MSASVDSWGPVVKSDGRQADVAWRWAPAKRGRRRQAEYREIAFGLLFDLRARSIPGRRQGHRIGRTRAHRIDP
ncbi:hypothetical protein WS93_21035 [Burkholderia cepacia]|nr:hypothetical protein WS93_21035 [Burkholderia cepacia]